MNELVFIGLGLNDEKGISLKGLEEIRTSDCVFLELYTSLMPDFSLERLEALCGRKIQVVSRYQLEDENGEVVMEVAKKYKTVLLIPGDPFIATTHITLRIDAEKQGIKTRIIHGTSIMSAIVSLSGLHNYKFGKTVTIPFFENFSETPYDVIAKNKSIGLHSLCLLDLNANENRYLSIEEAITMLRQVEQKKKMEVITHETVAVGIARAGGSDPAIKADFIEDLAKYQFGKPPYSLIFPGKLHFMEIDCLIAFARAPARIRRYAK